MNASAANRLSPKKLLHSKWTAAQPQAKEKHWLVVQLVQPEPVTVPPQPVAEVVIEAVYSGRRQNHRLARADRRRAVAPRLGLTRLCRRVAAPTQARPWAALQRLGGCATLTGPHWQP